MRPLETIHGLCAHEQRGAGTDAERRAARWLEQQLRAGGRDARIETFWCRPNWALAHAWHALLALAGSLLAVHAPLPGGALALAALLSTLADWLTGTSLGRRLTPERASQNVVAPPPAAAAGGRVRLILTANYDAGRTGVVYARRLRAPLAAARCRLHGLAPGWLGWLAIALAWVVAAAAARWQGASGGVLDAIQAAPTIALVVAAAALLELAGARFGPAAGDNASGVAVALAAARALDAAPPAGVAVHVVLAGASDGEGIGLRFHLRRQRRSLPAGAAVVLGLAPCAGGHPFWWHSDGPLVPLRYHATLRALCAGLRDAGLEPLLAPLRGRGASPALEGRMRALASIALGRLDANGLPPRSHAPDDADEHVDARALDLSVQLTLALVDAIDQVALRRRADQPPGATPAAAAPAPDLASPRRVRLVRRIGG
jgi:hypothetical protein